MNRKSLLGRLLSQIRTRHEAQEITVKPCNLRFRARNWWRPLQRRVPKPYQKEARKIDGLSAAHWLTRGRKTGHYHYRGRVYVCTPRGVRMIGFTVPESPRSQ